MGDITSHVLYTLAHREHPFRSHTMGMAAKHTLWCPQWLWILWREWERKRILPQKVQLRLLITKKRTAPTANDAPSHRLSFVLSKAKMADPRERENPPAISSKIKIPHQNIDHRVARTNFLNTHLLIVLIKKVFRPKLAPFHSHLLNGSLWLHFMLCSGKVFLVS